MGTQKIFQKFFSLFQNFWILVRAGNFFKFENQTPVQTPATIDSTGNLSIFLLKKWPHKLLLLPKLKSDFGSGLSKILTPAWDPGPKEKRRILPQSTLAHRIHGHLCHAYQRWSDSVLLPSDPILFLKNDIRIWSESCFGSKHTIRSENYPKVYCDAQHTFFCAVYILPWGYFAVWSKIAVGVNLPLDEHNWLK